MTQRGSVYSNSRRATITKNNNDGTVQIQIDEIGLQQTTQEFRVPLPLAWAGPNGEFIGGAPVRGSSVVVKQSQGGQWFIDSYIPSRDVFGDKDLMTVLRPGRAVMQVKGGNRIFIDPSQGIQAGSGDQFLHADPERNIISHNFDTEMAFTESGRKINGVIRRDLKENSNRGLLGATLDSHLYDEALTSIAMDPSANATRRSVGGGVRNPPLVENRSIAYEFAETYDVESDQQEAARTTDPLLSIDRSNNGRKENRTDVVSLGLQFPNHLIETVNGTVVDIFGNILDLNRAILPIGKLDLISLRKNADKQNAYARIRAQLRKSIAYHFEINTRKAGIIGDDGVESIVSIPDVNSTVDYARNRSRFSIDIDKEGQFKINVPQSSETGNIPLLARYENYSNVKAAEDPSVNPNDLVRNKEHQDVFLDGFGNGKIKLSGGDSTLDGYEAPIDRIKNEPFKYGTAFHDITKTCSSFLPNAPQINLYEDNPILHIAALDKIVEETIIVSGKGANAGGRSGSFHADGFISLSVGANTSDRQSMWIDCAGGVVQRIGKDKRNVSVATTTDGDILIQVNGTGLGNLQDSRFKNQNDASRIGTIDIRIMNGSKPATIFRMDASGVHVATEGRLEMTANQGIFLSTQGALHLNGERVAFHTNTEIPRPVERSGIPI